MIDGYDEAPSCSSFASGSFDIDIISSMFTVPNLFGV